MSEVTRRSWRFLKNRKFRSFFLRSGRRWRSWSRGNIWPRKSFHLNCCRSRHIDTKTRLDLSLLTSESSFLRFSIASRLHRLYSLRFVLSTIWKTSSRVTSRFLLHVQALTRTLTNRYKL